MNKLWVIWYHSFLMASSTSFSTADLTPEEYEKLVHIRTRKMMLLDEIQILQNKLTETTAQLESINDENPEQFKKLQTIAIKKFNENPKKGLKLLVESGLVKDSANEIAKFFLFCDQLKKSAIGDFLGEKEDFNLEVLCQFVRLQNFSNLMLVQALRNFLLLFRLPGEAQKIDRIMEHFAAHFCQQNSGIFEHQDKCYTLCYATIMLNTSLYNPSVKERMSLEDFFHITDSLNVPPELVTEIYNSIKSQPFKFPEEGDPANGSSAHYSDFVFKFAEKQGWLQKQGTYRTWNRRWFILTNKCLYYFEFPGSRDAKGIIPLENIKVRVLGSQEMDSNKRPHAFELYSPNSELIKACKTDSNGQLVEGQHSAYRMTAPSREEMHSWISAIQRSINKDQSIEEMLERRQRMASGASTNNNNNMNIMERRTVE